MIIKFGKYRLVIFWQTTKYRPNYDRDRQRKFQQKRKRLGLCKVCGVSVDEINKRTGKKYNSCKDCRKHENYLKKVKRDKKNKII